MLLKLKNKEGNVIGVLDVDSSDIRAFSDIDARWLEKILDLIHV